MDTAQGDESCKNNKTHPKGTSTEDDPPQISTLQNKHDIKKESSCSSLSSEDSSEEDFFQFDVSVLVKSVSRSREAANDFEELPQHEYDHNFAEEIKTQNGASDVSPKPGYLWISEPKQSPPVQVMNFSDTPDPNRIPSSIFAPAPPSPFEWSVASNESLFSIHVGDSSFRENAICFSKSGELTSYPCSPFHPFAPMPPISDVTSTAGTDVDVASEVEMPIVENGNFETLKDFLSENVEEPAGLSNHPADGMPNRTSSSHRSDGSMTSFRSFAFPILTAEGRSGLLKIEPESPLPISKQPHQLPAIDTQKATASAAHRWFLCCSCCHFCC